MNANQVIERIKEIKNIQIKYAELARIMDIQRQNMSRYKENDLPENRIRMVEDHFKIALLDDTETIIDRPEETLQDKYGISAKDNDFINSLLTNTTKRKMAILFFSAIDGDADATEVIKMIISNPILASTFSEKDPDGIISMGKKREGRAYKIAVEEAKNGK